MIVSDILPDSAALLNDAAGLQWSNSVLLPYFKIAYDEAVKRYQDEGIAFVSEVSSALTVTAGAKSITTLTDLIAPIKLEERAALSSDLYFPMQEESWEPDVELTEELRYWTFREGEIKLVGATVNREVRVYYTKSLSSITTVGNTVAIPDAKLFLMYRTSALAAGLSGGNSERARELDNEAERAFQAIINVQVKAKQGNPVRHRGYRA
jgi:hypothetical protein